MSKIKKFEASTRYVITESLHPGVLGVGAVTINGASIKGAAINKVFRAVAQVAVEAKWYQDGKQIGGLPSAGQLVKHFTGYSEIEKRLTDNSRYFLVYAGSHNSIESLGFELGIPNMGVLNYGSDPLPRLRLAGNPAVSFHSAGGKEVARAVAIYDSTVRNLVQLPPSKAETVLQRFKKP